MKQVFTLLLAVLLTAPLMAQEKTESKPSGKPEKNSRTDVLENIDARMLFVQGGTFTMGCTRPQDSCYYWEFPAHKVTLSNFYLAQYPVTQREWEMVMHTKPWFSKDCPDCPIEHISWYDAQVFISTLNQLSGKFYRLPTEAEWEYAARGGSHSHNLKYAGGNAVDNVAWYDSNSLQQSHPVGLKEPNELGLYDMSGNVWEWCSDWFSEKYYTESPEKDPQGPGKDVYRVCRGGSWWSEKGDLRVSNRDRYPPDARDDDVGFRLAKD